MAITAKKKSKTGSQILPKIIHIYSKKRRKSEGIVQVLSSKNVVIYLFIPSVFFKKPCLKKIY